MPGWNWMTRLTIPLMLAGFTAACSDSPPHREAVEFSPVDLETVVVRQQTIDEEIVFDGTLEALNQSTVASETNARVIELPFDIDDYVEKGQVIVRFRDSEQKAQMSSAEAALSEAEAHFTDTRLEYERAEKLYERGLIPKAEMDSATAAYESAQARVRAAEAGRKRAQEQLEHTVVRAPYSGIVVKRHIEIGETATVGHPLMTGLSLEHLRAVVEIPQQHIGPLRKHREARVIFPDGRWVEGSELRIPPTADAETHTFRVLVSLPPDDHGVYPGTLVKVAFVRGEAERLVVPTESVVRRGELTAAYVVDDDNRISFRYLRTGSPTGDGLMPVLSGVRSGERVAIDGVAAAITYKKQMDPETGNEP